MKKNHQAKQNATKHSKRISIQDARKYYRKKNHSAEHVHFWRSPK